MSSGHLSPDAPPVLRSNRVRTWIRTWVIERTLRGLPRTDRALDLCCGYGFYFSINPQAIGVDGDPACVSTLRDRGFDVRLANILEPLPFSDEQFDVVLAHDVLEHFVLDELETIFAEVRRILSSEGKFVVWVPDRKGYDAGVDPLVGHRLFVTDSEVRALAAGRFDVDEHYPEPFPRSLGRHFAHNKEVFVLTPSS
jgi:SAM-dependent methyltransferase